MVARRYSAEERRRNRCTIVLWSTGALGAIVISAVGRGWSVGGTTGAVVIVVLIAALLWSQFASKSARQLDPDRRYVIPEGEPLPKS